MESWPALPDRHANRVGLKWRRGDEFRRGTTEDDGEWSWEHLVRSQYASIDKARQLLGYAPRYEPEDAVLESVRWLIDHGQFEVASPLKV